MLWLNSIVGRRRAVLAVNRSKESLDFSAPMPDWEKDEAEGPAL
jgi:hypothetical protein